MPQSLESHESKRIVLRVGSRRGRTTRRLLGLSLLLSCACAFQCAFTTHAFAFSPLPSPSPSPSSTIRQRRRTAGCDSNTNPLSQAQSDISRSSFGRRQRRYSLYSSASQSLQSSESLTNTGITNSNNAVELKWCDFSFGSSDDKDNNNERHTPVILLHGLLGSKRNFASIATSLSSQLERKRRIIGLDLRNHGENHHDWREDMCYTEMAEDVIAFMDSQSLDKAILVGHSMGGKVAQSVALLTPDRVEGLVVLDIAPVTYTTDEPHWKAVQDIVQVLADIHVFPGVTKREVDAQLRAAVPDPALRAFCLTNLDVPQGRWKIHMAGIAAQLDQLAGFDIDAAVYQYHGDVFIINGGQSRFVRHAYMESIQSYFPNHMLTTIRGAGHWVHAEAPDDTSALLKRFLDR